MANRHLARSTVLQTLYEWDFSGQKIKPEDILKRDASEFAPGTDSGHFMKNLLSGVLDKQKDLDNIITKAAPEWPIDKISVMDRNILRIGLYELLFADRAQVPPKVAINEAIELEDMIHAVETGDAGAIVHFLGIVRNNTEGREVSYLEYEAYPPMAEKKMDELRVRLDRLGELDYSHFQEELILAETMIDKRVERWAKLMMDSAPAYGQSFNGNSSEYQLARDNLMKAMGILSQPEDSSSVMSKFGTALIVLRNVCAKWSRLLRLPDTETRL